MPKNIIKKFEKEYGKDKGKSIYYATANKLKRNPETFKKDISESNSSMEVPQISGDVVKFITGKSKEESQDIYMKYILPRSVEIEKEIKNATGADEKHDIMHKIVKKILLDKGVIKDNSLKESELKKHIKTIIKEVLLETDVNNAEEKEEVKIGKDILIRCGNILKYNDLDEVEDVEKIQELAKKLIEIHGEKVKQDFDPTGRLKNYHLGFKKGNNQL